MTQSYGYCLFKNGCFLFPAHLIVSIHQLYPMQLHVILSFLKPSFTSACAQESVIFASQQKLQCDRFVKLCKILLTIDIVQWMVQTCFWEVNLCSWYFSAWFIIIANRSLTWYGLEGGSGKACSSTRQLGSYPAHQSWVGSWLFSKFIGCAPMNPAVTTHMMILLLPHNCSTFL